MKGQVWQALSVCAGLVALVSAGNSTDGSCGPTNGYGTCTKASHCCRYGWCGNGGEYCAQGCNPLYSYDVESCYPLPVCQSKTYTFGTNGNARLVKKENYKKVDPINVDFVIDTGELENTPDGLILTLRKDKIGSKITSTRAMHYGKITFEMQTAWSGGVVTAAVLMGDASEEVDIEFTGNALKSVQSNIFYDYVASGATHTLDSDSSRSFANYSLNWSQDKVEWLYSKSSQDRILRTVTPQQKHIPKLPMYAQMSIWPGGASENSGTRGWAGGLIDWNDPRFKQSGDEFRFILKSATIQCSDEYSPNEAYKYIRNGETKNELAFKVWKLEGYGVSPRVALVPRVDPAPLRDTKGTRQNEKVEKASSIQERAIVIPLPKKLQKNATEPDVSESHSQISNKQEGSQAGATPSRTSWTSSWSEPASSWTSSWSEPASSWTSSWTGTTSTWSSSATIINS